MHRMVEKQNSTPEGQKPIEQRVEALNEPLKEANLIPLFQTRDAEVADASKNRTELLSTEKIVPFSKDKGVYFALHPALFRKEPETRGQFLPIYLTKEAAERNNILVPMVRLSNVSSERPRNFRQMSEPVMTSDILNSINAELSDSSVEDESKRNLRATLPNELSEVKGPFAVRGYKIIDDNKRFYSGLVLEVENVNGDHEEIPLLISANSGKGMPEEGSHGTVYVVEIGDEIVLGKQYRPLIPQEYLPEGQIDNTEISRGFPRAILDRLGELKAELNLSQEDITEDKLGTIKQDPTTDYVTPLFMTVRVNQEAANKISSSGAGFERIAPFRAKKEETVSMIQKGEIWDAHSVAGIGAYLLKRDGIMITPEAENLGVVLEEVFQAQYGQYGHQALRGSLSQNESLGRIAVDSGKARIFPHVASPTFDESELRGLESQGKNLRVVPIREALQSLVNCEYDIVTASALLKTFLNKGVLGAKS